jgi:1-phosphatidylinositol-3-phosphate 5-kinase
MITLCHCSTAFVQEESFARDDLVFGKALPRLPSTYEDLDETDIFSSHTPVHRQQSLPPVSQLSSARQGLPRRKSAEDLTASSSSPATVRKETDPAILLSKLRHTFQNTERALYVQLARTQVGSLNNVRWSFHSTASGAVRRLSAWENKHLSGKSRSQTDNKLSGKEPEWWGSGSYAVPGGNVIVREGDWGSIIAFTLRYIVLLIHIHLSYIVV